MFTFSAIAVSVKKLKEKNKNKNKKSYTPPSNTVSKEQFFKWQSEGKCGCCGADSGEFHGICDYCRFN